MFKPKLWIGNLMISIFVQIQALTRFLNCKIIRCLNIQKILFADDYDTFLGLKEIFVKHQRQ